MINSMSIDITTHCNLKCLHCIRDKLSPRKHMPLELLEYILKEVSSIGIREVCLTGGEVALHPDIEEIFDLFVKYRTIFSFVSNGLVFEEKILSFLKTKSKTRQHLAGACFSLDGATGDSHDAIRGNGSYDKVISSIKSCEKENIPVSVKSIMHRKNLNEIADTAFLCASLGVQNLGFIVLTPSPYLISNKLMPSPQEYVKAIRFIKGKIQPSFSMEIGIEGYSDSERKVSFCNPARGISVDHEGNLIFCCNLSHPTAADRPDTFGREFLGNIREIGIEEGILRHYRLLGWFMDKVVHAGPGKSGRSTCVDCLHLFGKMDWIKSYETPYNRHH